MENAINIHIKKEISQDFWILSGILCLLFLLDFATTIYVLHNQLGTEGNPLMVAIVSNIPVFIAVKFGILTLLLFSFFNYESKNPKIARIGIESLIIIMFGVIINNSIVLIRSSL